MHPLKASPPILTIFVLLKSIEVKPSQPIKAKFPIAVTLSGILVFLHPKIKISFSPVGDFCIMALYSIESILE